MVSRAGSTNGKIYFLVAPNTINTEIHLKTIYFQILVSCAPLGVIKHILRKDGAACHSSGAAEKGLKNKISMYCGGRLILQV